MLSTVGFIVRVTSAMLCWLTLVFFATGASAGDVTLGRVGSLLLSTQRDSNLYYMRNTWSWSRLFSSDSSFSLSRLTHLRRRRRLRANLPTKAAIYGGTVADAAIARRHAFIQMNYDNTFYTCGGTILTEYVILSAAHCFFEPRSSRPLKSVNVQPGLSYLDYSNMIPAALVYIHKNFRVNESAQMDTYENDIAVVVLETPIPAHSFERMTIAMARPDMPRGGEPVWAAGFGYTELTPSFLSIPLLQTQLARQFNNRCIRAEKAEYQPLVDSESLICATSPGFPNIGRNDTCNGDSGGPLYWYREDDGAIVQIGITSWGPEECARKGDVAWYTRLRSFVPDLQSLFIEVPDTSAWILRPLEDKEPVVEPTPTEEP